VVSIGVGIGGQRTINGWESTVFVGSSGVENDDQRTINGVGSGGWWCRAVGIVGHGYASGCESAYRGVARWESAVSGRSTGCESTHRGVARWESAVGGRSTGCETIVVVRRAVRCSGALVGGLAGIASAVEVSA
jgi:hypothetical protein